MIVQQSRLAQMLVYSFVLGVFLGVVYDVFRIRRLAFYCEKNTETTASIFHRQRMFIEEIVIFIEDVLFWLISTVSMCIFIYYVNSGRFRGVALIGAVIGFFVYYKTIGKVVMLLSGCIINFLRAAFRLLIRFTLYPVGRMLRYIFIVPFNRLFLWIYGEAMKKKCLNNAQNGFGITVIKGKIKNEKSFKYICKGGGGRFHSVLHGNDNQNAV
ncbi:MAG: hypothetical protein E7593_04730 [Ruminococcaceae bacterium]|nr:hypothetical protein [Oscillospiraceae bacterium]